MLTRDSTELTDPGVVPSLAERWSHHTGGTHIKWSHDAGGRHSLSISEGTLWNWVRDARAKKTRDADPDGLSESERDELRRLRKEVIELRTDKEILRRAAAYFARETMR
jgi:hypothetical protein